MVKHVIDLASAIIKLFRGSIDLVVRKPVLSHASNKKHRPACAVWLARLLFNL